MAPTEFEAEAAQRALRLAHLLQQLRAAAYQQATEITGLSIGSLSKRKLSQLLGVSPTLINKYENAEIDPWDIRWSLIRQIAHLCGLSLDDFDQALVGEENLSDATQPSELIEDLQLQLQKLASALEGQYVSARSVQPEQPISWFGRYLRTLIADEVRESGKTEQALHRQLIAAFPSLNPAITDRFQAVLQGESELTAAEIEVMAAPIAAALSVVIATPVTANQLRSLLP